MLLPTISLRNKAENSLIKQYLQPTRCIIINQTAVAHVAQRSSNYLRIKIKRTLTLDNLLIKLILTSNLSKTVVFNKIA